MMPPELVADSAITAAGLVGLWALARSLRRDGPETQINRRLRGAIRFLGILMLLRLLYWTTGAGIFGAVLFAVAAFLPLMATLVVEGLTLRHAPKVLKVWVVLGGGLLALAPLFPWGGHAVWPLGALVAFQITSLSALVVLVLRRNRADVPAAQNATIDRLLLALVISLPLLATDFRGLSFDPPARMSALALLIYCYLALDLRRSGRNLRDSVVSILVVCAAAAICVGVCALIVELDLRGAAQIGLVLVAVALSTQALTIMRDLQKTRLRSVVLAHLAQGSEKTQDAFLDGLTAALGPGAAAMLHDDNLGDFDAAFMERLRDKGVLSQGDRHAEPWMSEQSAWFFERFHATHALWLASEPRRVLAVSVPALAASDTLELELRAAQRLAVRISPEGQGIA